MKKLLAVVAILSILSLVSNNVVAAGNETYVVIDIGQASVPDICTGYPGGCSTTSIAYRPGIGYQLNHNVGFEAGYLAGMLFEANSTNDNYAASGFHFGVVGSMPLNDSTEIIGKLGLAQIDVELNAPSANYWSSYTNSNLVFGFGVRFNLNDQIKLRATYEDFGEVKGDSALTPAKASMISAGMQFSF